MYFLKEDSGKNCVSCLDHGMDHTVSMRRKILMLLYVKYTFLNKAPSKYTNNGFKFVFFNFHQGVIAWYGCKVCRVWTSPKWVDRMLGLHEPSHEMIESTDPPMESSDCPNNTVHATKPYSRAYDKHCPLTCHNVLANQYWPDT